MGLGKFFKKVVKPVGKVALAPFTAGASLQGGNLVKGTISNVLSGLPVGNMQNQGGIMGLLGNVVSGAVGLGQDYLQSQINLSQQKELAKYNANQQSILNQQAFDNNLKMWGMQNFYNSPSEQMKRLQSAGMNPNLVYGSGNITGNTAGSVPQLEPAKFDTGAFHPVDTRIERAQLALAMESQYQQVENQKIHNDLMRQRLELAERSADRADTALMLRNARVNTGLTNHVKSGNSMDVEYKRLRNQRLKEDLENPFKSSWAKDLYTQPKNVVNAIVGGILDVYSERTGKNYYKVTGSGKNYVTYGRKR